MGYDYKYWVWLSTIPKISPLKRRLLLEKLGSPKNVWDAGELDLSGLDFLSPDSVKQLRSTKFRDEAEIHFENLYKHGVKMTTIEDKLYPQQLKNTYDPPVVLFTKGTLQGDEKMIAVVGSRNATPYGLKTAERISFELAKAGITIVSGMAKGVDSHAHKGALKAGGRTVAVMGCGLDRAYPPGNEGLMAKIINSGAAVSEYVTGVPPMAHNFPARNRIISGASYGVVIIEAGEKSGSLITADFALEQGREVFAVPGNVNSSTSVGTNKLIREGAKMVTCIEDILEELKNSLGTNTSIKKVDHKKQRMENNDFKGLDEEEALILKSLKTGQLHIDAVAFRCGLAVQTVASLLLMLELKGLVEQLPGKVFKYKAGNKNKNML